MDDRAGHPALAAHLSATLGLDRRQAARAIEEVLAYFDEPVADYVARRHRELQAQGVANSVIYGRLARELESARFRAPDLSERQLRRIIYG